MARQVEGSLPATERDDDAPALTADALDRSLEALRETIEHAAARWRQLESRIADQDRAIRELRDEVRRARLELSGLAGHGPASVPELTEIVMTAAGEPPARDPRS